MGFVFPLFWGLQREIEYFQPHIGLFIRFYMHIQCLRLEIDRLDQNLVTFSFGNNFIPPIISIK